ncbi:DUF4365 domain-containing protein [Streptomyces sp. NPDC051840]|uniref:DUF4365 domain-containing protein n=1 Tax=Streptomyces sp. NPDC051840 TaxID=3154752 RepID=UPI0034499462
MPPRSTHGGRDLPGTDDPLGPDDLVDGQLPMTARQEHFSIAFTRMITYEAGCSIKTHEVDYEGVDITLVSSASYLTYYGPQFELQLKCTTQASRYLKDDHMAWPMKAKPFRKLTQPNRYLRAYLGVLVLPREPKSWLSVTEDGLLTESCMYWESADKLRVDDEIGDSHTVHLPRRNLFVREQLLGIMNEIGDAEGGLR